MFNDNHKCRELSRENHKKVMSGSNKILIDLKRLLKSFTIK